MAVNALLAFHASLSDARPRPHPPAPPGTPPPVPVNTALPTVSGTPAIGAVLTASPGTWTNTPTSYRYLWGNDQTLIGGATGSTYTIPAGSQGRSYAVIVWASNASGESSAAVSSVTAAVPGGANLYWGATIGTQFTGTVAEFDHTATVDFQNQDAGGKALSVLSLGISWGAHWAGGSGLSNQTANGTANWNYVQGSFDNQIVNNGIVPLLMFQSDNPNAEAWANWSDSAIAGGSMDNYLNGFAAAAAAWGKPFFMRLDHEMNGNWYPWSTGTFASGSPWVQNTVANYVAMWKHVYNIFQANGATNANFVWCPYQAGYPENPSYASLYPGDAYVDWLSTDIYNFGGYLQPAVPYDGSWQDFSALFTKPYNDMVALSSKPIIIVEIGCNESGTGVTAPTGQTKATWITSMFNSMASFPQLHAIMWYDKQSQNAALETSTAAQTAFANGIANAKYQTNHYSALAGPKIAVP